MQTRSDLQRRESRPDVELKHPTRLLEVGWVGGELVNDG